MSEVGKRYEEAVRLLRRFGYSEKMRPQVDELLDAIGFRHLLEIEEAAREIERLLGYVSGRRVTGNMTEAAARLRTALAARATEGEKT